MRFATPTLEDLEYIAANLREQDALEVLSSHGHTPREAVMAAALAPGSICHLILGDDDSPVGVCGLDGDTIWMLGTDQLTSTRSHRQQLAIGGRRWVNWLALLRLESCGYFLFGNFVFAANVESIRWLKFLGFEVEDKPIPMGPSGRFFREFSMRGTA